jgi:hypothetical protein
MVKKSKIEMLDRQYGFNLKKRIVSFKAQGYSIQQITDEINKFLKANNITDYISFAAMQRWLKSNEEFVKNQIMQSMADQSEIICQELEIGKELQKDVELLDELIEDAGVVLKKELKDEKMKKDNFVCFQMLMHLKNTKLDLHNKFLIGYLPDSIKGNTQIAKTIQNINQPSKSLDIKDRLQNATEAEYEVVEDETEKITVPDDRPIHEENGDNDTEEDGVSETEPIHTD